MGDVLPSRASFGSEPSGLGLESQETPRDHISPKIRNFLAVAEQHGYRWAWADTCCIDKTSSAELTEAINSMFRYYALSDVCYVYLPDVSSDCEMNVTNSEFHRSRWHVRGWTLQELLAPKNVVFLSQDWSFLGKKFTLADTIESITHIPASVLRFEKDVTDMSVAARMSWAAKRETTRVEDEAYSLFGLFGVNMPTLYGEGSNAFYRLQEEIFRTSTDTTLLVWGQLFKASRVQSVWPFNAAHSHPSRYLFAPSPKEFRETGRVTCGSMINASTQSVWFRFVLKERH